MKWVLPIFAALAGGCLAPPVESPPTTTVEDRRVNISQTVNNKVDLLFMVDNSNSMDPKQKQLKARFPAFIQRLQDFAGRGLPAWYHLGVVTSDMGAGNSNACLRGGDGGRLNTNDRTNSKNPVSCGLGNGLSYIDFNQLDGTANVVGSVETAFQCIASVGADGCGFEHQLESVYQALTSNVNPGFLRDDAVLAVVFLTDEDDCSAPPDSDLFDPTKTGTDYSQPGQYGPWNSFRCTQFGVLAGGEPLPWPGTGAVSDPQPAGFTEMPGPGKLFGLDRYINLFTHDRASGGVKDKPDEKLMVIDIAGPVQTFRTLWSDPNAVGVRKPCATYNGTTCTVVLDHSCQATSDANYDGDPAVRLHAVVSQAAKHDEGTSICADSYDQALEQLSDFIQSHVSKGCLGAPIDHPEKPDCNVDESIGDTHSFLPWCGDPNAGLPCWQLVSRPECAPVLDPVDGSMQQLGLEVKRNEQPQETIHDDVSCAIVAASQK